MERKWRVVMTVRMMGVDTEHEWSGPAADVHQAMVLAVMAVEGASLEQVVRFQADEQ